VVNWLTCAPPQADTDITVRLRYRQEDQRARATQQSDGGVVIVPGEPQRAVTPGQSAVIYQGSRCLGGGVIVQTDI
jgi:tRNA-specific 2-thiouridylase